ncbi:MAG: TRAP transporter large permease [Spirochaetes bacterium]|nr:MAG: TRAP transporter large permease [Spirochaetota bacterium]
MSLVILLISFFSLLMFKCPISFSLLISSMVALLVKGLPLRMVPQNLVEGAESFTLLAVPFYILAGEIMNVSGITERIFNFAMAIIGHVRGGLGHVNVLASMIFAGISGSASADAAGLGRIEIEAMRKEGYDISFAASITAVSSTIGPIIPPSIHLVIYGAITEVSVADLFIAGILPGILIGLALMITIYIMAKSGIAYCPTRPKQPFIEIWRAFLKASFSLFAPVIILGGILIGVVTPTEAGVIAVLYTSFLGLMYGELSWEKITRAFKNTIRSTAVVMFLLATSKSFAWLITVERVPENLTNLMFHFTSNKDVILIFICIGLLFIGTVESATANLIIVTPILVSIAGKLNIDLVHLGLITVFALMIGLITPPIGTSLYIVSDVASISFEKMVRATLIYLIPMIVVLFLLAFFPQIVLFLPKLFGYTG